MCDWKHRLKADPTQWLLEWDNPPIRYGTLVDILDLPATDVEARAAQAAIPAYAPVAELLAAQDHEGYWGRRDFYLPRLSRGAFWVLSVLGDLGLTREEEHVRQACENLFTDQRENGAFCRRYRRSGRREEWLEKTEPCTQARIVRFLIQLGYANYGAVKYGAANYGAAEDPRLRRAIDWLLPIQRQDGMWFCRGATGHGCLRATLDILRVAAIVGVAIDPQTAAQPGIAQAAAAVCDLLMAPRMSRYHVGEEWGMWECLKYPYFGFSIISALDALARLGYTLAEPKIAAAMEYLLSRQLPDGAWPMDECWPRPPMDFGQPGEPNKWLTLDALRLVKRFYSSN